MSSSRLWSSGRGGEAQLAGEGGVVVQNFQGRIEALDKEQDRSSALWRGDAKNKLHLLPNFAHLQFQTGL